MGRLVSDQIEHLEGPGRQRPADLAARIRADIVAGLLPLGGRLKLHEIATRYSTGQMPIREALRQLEGEGLVETSHFRGARVRAVGAEFVTNLFDLRIVIEALLARRAAERITPAELDAMRDAERDFAAQSVQASPLDLLRANREFHARINAAARNPEATAVLARQQDLITALWAQHGYGLDRFAEMVADHRQILGAIEARDAELAACFATAHAAKARNAMLARLSGT